MAFSFFVLEIILGSYYANEGSDDVIGCSTKTVQHSIENFSRNIKAVFLKFDTRNVHHKRDKNYSFHVVAMTTAMSLALTQGSSTPNNLMGRVRTILEPCLFLGRPLVPLKKVANGDIWLFTEREWNQGCCHGHNIVGVIFFFCDVHSLCQV